MMENLSNLINESTKIFDDFEQNLHLPKNYQSILDCIENIESDLKKYDYESNSRPNNTLIESDRETIINSLNSLILKIQKMNRFAKAKANLNNKFNDYRI